MTIYTCIPEWENMLTCIYEAWSSGKGHKNIRLMLEPIEQYTLFDEYIHVDADSKKATSVIDAVNMKISPYVYHELALTAMAFEADTLDNIYRVMILGFHFGPNVLSMLQYRDVVRNREIRLRVSREAGRFQEFVRFSEVDDGVYVSHIEPKSRICSYLAQVFSDRMPSEHFMIIDDVHREAVVHPKNQSYYMWKLSDEEFERLLATEDSTDEYTDMWKAFFNTIAIKERTNPKCQLNHAPLWARKHMVEFE